MDEEIRTDDQKSSRNAIGIAYGSAEWGNGHVIHVLAEGNNTRREVFLHSEQPSIACHSIVIAVLMAPKATDPAIGRGFDLHLTARQK